MNNYKGYQLFNDIEDKALQAWNRFIVMMNIIKDTGSRQEGTNYMNHFGVDDKVRVKETVRLVKDKGYSTVRATING